MFFNAFDTFAICSINPCRSSECYRVSYTYTLQISCICITPVVRCMSVFGISCSSYNNKNIPDPATISKCGSACPASQMPGHSISTVPLIFCKIFSRYTCNNSIPLLAVRSGRSLRALKLAPTIFFRLFGIRLFKIYILSNICFIRWICR